jgi:hypothetical protein
MYRIKCLSLIGCVFLLSACVEDNGMYNTSYRSSGSLVQGSVYPGDNYQTQNGQEGPMMSSNYHSSASHRAGYPRNYPAYSSQPN